MKQKCASKTIAVLFGGRSTEHEISIITALQMIHAMDPYKYKGVPVYIDPSGKWYTGNKLLSKEFYKRMPQSLSEVQRVIFLPEPGQRGLLKASTKGTFSENELIEVDAYFLAFHGQYGEDGCIQGMLEMADVPYTGCGVSASAIAMNKYHSKVFLQAHGIPVLPSTVVMRQAALKNFSEQVKAVGKVPGLENFPLFVKPCHLGSSIGISKATDFSELGAALAKAFRYDEEALVEPCITELMELNVAVLEGDSPQASVVEMPLSSGGALTYEDKYLRGGKKNSSSLGMASLTRVIDPKEVSSSLKQQATDYALKAFKLLGCSGVGRFDFIVDKKTNTLYFNELNPLPGSLSFYLWEKNSPPVLYTTLIDRMINQAFKRQRERLALQRDIGFKALG